MFLFLQEQVQEHAEEAPILVKLVNQYFGEYAYNFEMKYTYPFWKNLLNDFRWHYGQPEEIRREFREAMGLE